MRNITFHILLGPPSSGKSFGLSSYLEGVSLIIDFPENLRKSISVNISIGLYTTENPQINFQLMKRREEAGGIGASGLELESLSELWKLSNKSLVPLLDYIIKFQNEYNQHLKISTGYFVRIMDNNYLDLVLNDKKTPDPPQFNANQIRVENNCLILESDTKTFSLEVV